MWDIGHNSFMGKFLRYVYIYILNITAIWTTNTNIIQRKNIYLPGHWIPKNCMFLSMNGSLNITWNYNFWGYSGKFLRYTCNFHIMEDGAPVR